MYASKYQVLTTVVCTAGDEAALSFLPESRGDQGILTSLLTIEMLLSVCVHIQWAVLTFGCKSFVLLWGSGYSRISMELRMGSAFQFWFYHE